MDYPPAQRDLILDYLFKPNFGASLQHLKVRSCTRPSAVQLACHRSATCCGHDVLEWGPVGVVLADGRVGC